jgi:predicted dithiol-disulfide oxidoreductase (DUF899 family)
MNLKNIKNNITLITGRSGLLLRKHSPEILMTVGIVGVVTSAVMACKATLKAEDVIDKAKTNIDKIHQAKELIAQVEEDTHGVTKYSEQDYKKDMALVYVQTGWGFVKLYGPAVTLGVASIACLLGAHGIMKKRNLALVAAYKAVEQSFADYRNRVKKELGSDADRHFKYGTDYKTVTEEKVDAEGNVTYEEKTVEIVNTNNISQYARYFDEETSSQWSPTPEYNMMFLKTQQAFANDLLHSRGHLFLNEVYDNLGLPRSKDGAVVGWVLGEGDDYVDFGIYETNVATYETAHDTDTIGEKRRDFVNGYRNSILLDFNVSGVIYNLI